MDDDLYDEFGNFIGEEVEASEEESEHGVDVGNFAYGDDYPEAAPADDAADEHMDLDGMYSCVWIVAWHSPGVLAANHALPHLQMKAPPTPSSSTRTSSTTRAPLRSTARALRPWCRRRMRSP